MEISSGTVALRLGFVLITLYISPEENVIGEERYSLEIAYGIILWK